MNTKEKLVQIIKNAKTFEEGFTMKKMKEADAGSLAKPIEAPASMKTGPGGKYSEPVGQDKSAQPALQKEDAGELAAPKEAPAAIPVGDGFATPTPTSVGQDKGQTPVTVNKEDASEEEEEAEEEDEEEVEELEEKFKEARKKLKEARKKEAVKEEEKKLEEARHKKKREALGEEEDEEEGEVKLEKFKEEYQDDMTKVTDILESMKEKIDALERKVEGFGVEPAIGAKEEPQPPITESARLSNTFMEAIGNKDLEADKAFKEAVRKVIY